MKYGVRKPNIKKSIKARTTGKVKRQVKKAVNPLYGKKGMGIVNDPKKAAYNAVYNRTTVGVSDIAKGLTAANGNPAASSSTNAPQKKEYSANTYSVCGILMLPKRQKDGKTTRKQVNQNNYIRSSDITRPAKRH